MAIGVNTIYAVVLCGAALHALWNGLVKGSSDTLTSAIAISGAAGAIAACLIPWFPAPLRASWPYLGASLVLQVAYVSLIARTYALTDMGLSYPIMRGAAPLIVALVSLIIFTDPLNIGMLMGIITICSGILCMSLAQLRQSGASPGLVLALANAGVIAAYTLVDGTGVRLSGSPVSYTLWVFLLEGVAMLLIGLRVRTRALPAYLGQHWKMLVLGGFCVIASYGTALWAMTLAPIAVISALREASILFGVLLSVFVLRERPTIGRLSGAAILLAGIVILRLA